MGCETARTRTSAARRIAGRRQNYLMIMTAAVLWAACVLWSVTPGVAAPASVGLRQAPESTRSVWDGVYTNAQAERGRKQYFSDCVSCHGENLEGADEAPSLAGDAFLSRWIDLTVGDLVERTRISMPQDRPGALSRQAYADIVAFLFSFSKFPAGDTELDRNAAVLNQILIDAKPQK